MSDPKRSLLEAFARHQGDLKSRSRFTMSIVPGVSDRSFPVVVLGVLPTKRELIVSAPKNGEGSLIAVNQGLNLRCTWFSACALFRFDANITKVAFEPQPLLYLRLADCIWTRTVRTVPRALVNLPAVIRVPQVETVLLVDCSISGARIALHRDAAQPVGSRFELSVKPPLQLDLDVLLKLECTVMSEPEPAAAGFPDICYQGLKFTDVVERDLLVLHAFVQQSMVAEMDFLSQVLLRAQDIRELKD